MPELEHDQELIERIASMHEGNALAHLKSAEGGRDSGEQPRVKWGQAQMLGASGLVIAASYWSLLTPSRALELYRRATLLYLGMGHSYWMVLALASAREDAIAATLSTTDDVSQHSPQSIAFAMVVNEIAEVAGRGARTERLNSEWRHTGNIPVGRLGIPLDHYGRCAQAMRLARENRNAESFSAVVADYVQRAAEAIRGASHDTYHWKRLQSTILPAEPEAVAMTRAMSIMSHRLFQKPLKAMPNLDVHARLLIEVGEEMRNAA